MPKLEKRGTNGILQISASRGVGYNTPNLIYFHTNACSMWNKHTELHVLAQSQIFDILGTSGMIPVAGVPCWVATGSSGGIRWAEGGEWHCVL